MFSHITRRSMLAATGYLAGGIAASAAVPSLAAAASSTVAKSAGGPNAQRGRVKKLELPRAGDFASSPLLGVYDPLPEDQTHRSEYFGLPLDGAWPYGGLETESGKRYLLLRKITYQTTNYLIIQIDGRDSVEIDRRSFQSPQFGGFVKRRFENGYDIYEGRMSLIPGGPGFELKIGHNDFSWVENNILSIKGRRFAPAWHVYVPWREENGGGQAGGCYYTSCCWDAEGEIFGEKAKGFFILDHDYLPKGVDWNDENDLIWSKLQGAWGVFATEWDDGTVEWGHFAKGFGDFQFGSVSSNKEDLSVYSRDVQAKIDFSADGWTKRIEWTFNNDEKWEFVTAPNGNFNEASALFSKLNGVDWRGHSGIMRRVGEKRKAVRHIAWQEVFPARMGWKG